ncbi:hypothetical protein J5N97_001998 [Dioscorea zingiberensis]|uniref:Uncharacterized protein n=1 Tax=Dioscorea zingiberensis TaxID=325984 RepID=A0A9D5BVB4_9LILI|nr:hypothetical protein J5N97_001998 [Dioscorea zingiberensis]
MRKSRSPHPLLQVQAMKLRIALRMVVKMILQLKAVLSLKSFSWLIEACLFQKLLGEGRLKLMLNSDGEIEEEQETHAERHARTLALAQELDVLPKKDKAHLRKRQRWKKDNGSGQLKKKERKKRGTPRFSNAVDAFPT